MKPNDNLRYLCLSAYCDIVLNKSITINANILLFFKITISK